MKVAVFSMHEFEKQGLANASNDNLELQYIDLPLKAETAILAKDCEAVSLFVNDDASAPVLQVLAAQGCKGIALRSAGFNHVDVREAQRLGMTVARVPAYSPYAVAEHTVALMMALNRKLIRANSRVHDLNFSLDGLTGFDMNGKTAGIIGTGKIGAVVARILHGFGCRILAVDAYPDTELARRYGIEYTDHDTLYRDADIITLHVPLTPETKYIINAETLCKMKRGVMLVNTSRGALVNTRDVIAALKSGHIGYLGLDVYEEEGPLFFKDHSEDILQDDTISRLLTFRNVIITSHQAFLTNEALKNIADTTIHNLMCFKNGIASGNEVTV